jgi:hypothetical protein
MFHLPARQHSRCLKQGKGQSAAKKECLLEEEKTLLSILIFFSLMLL